MGKGVQWTKVLTAAFGAFFTLGVVRQASAHKDPADCLFNGPSTSISTQGITNAEHGERICYIVGIANNCASCCNVTDLDSSLRLPNGMMVPITLNATVNQGDSFFCPGPDPRCVAPSNCTIPGMIGYQYIVNHVDERGQTGSGCPIVPVPGFGTVWASIFGLGVDHISTNDGTASICQSIPVSVLHACCEPCTATCSPVGDVSDCQPPNIFNPVLDCSQVICVPLICNDGDPCTTEMCVPGTGCVSTPTVCNDNNQCTTDSCLSGIGCVTSPIICNDGQQCTVDTCDPATGCVFTPTQTCDDGNACTTDLCVPGVGCVSTPIDCDDGNRCTTDTCDPATGCASAPIACEDGNACTFDQCDPTIGCVFPDIPPCFDGDACTTDACDPGRGCVFTPIACNDGNICTTDSCNKDGSCTYTNNTGPCEDEGLGCTDDICSGGVCTHVLSTAGTVCRPAVNGCDIPEICDGSSNLCPTNLVITSCMDDDHCCPLGCNYTNDNDCIDRVSVTEKGSIIYFSKIELKWDSQGRLIQDTFVTIVNDYPEDVFIQWYFINGDAPTSAVIVNGIFVERAHRGWNWADCTRMLTHNESTFFSAARGLPMGCQPFTVLDSGNPPGRPDPDAALPGNRVLRGYAIAFAVDSNGHEISWNHLSGHVDIVNYLERSAWEFNGYALQCLVQPTPGLPCGTDHVLNLDGIEYDFAFDRLIIDFYSVGSLAFSPGVVFPGGVDSVLLDTDLTLYPMSIDLRQDNDGPVTTKAKFDIWNQNEDGFSGTTRCITCWDQTLLSNYGAPNHFLIDNLHTDKGKARIDGIQSDVCDPPSSCCNLSTDIDCYPSVNHPAIDTDCSKSAALLGVSDKLLFFNGPGAQRRQSDAGMTLVGQGSESATVKWDVITPPQPLSGDDLNPRLEEVLEIDEASLTPVRPLDSDENRMRPRKD